MLPDIHNNIYTFKDITYHKFFLIVLVIGNECHSHDIGQCLLIHRWQLIAITSPKRLFFHRHKPAFKGTSVKPV